MGTAAGYLDLLSRPADDDVPGWFNPTDALLLTGVDELQGRRGVTGDVLEIGVFQGKSAILLGFFPRAGERLVVCDIFEDATAVGSDNADESAAFYGGLTRAGFERNYLRFHPELPVVHACPSTELDAVVEPGSCRIVHVDGSHLHDVVRADLRTARRVLGPGGVVVVDDWSSPHVPGVAMALWTEHAAGDLVPLAFTRGKFYATWDPAGLTAGDLAEWAAARAELDCGNAQQLGAHRATYVTMAPELAGAYSASLFGSGRAPATFTGF